MTWRVFLPSFSSIEQSHVANVICALSFLHKDSIGNFKSNFKNDQPDRFFLNLHEFSLKHIECLCKVAVWYQISLKFSILKYCEVRIKGKPNTDTDVK